MRLWSLGNVTAACKPHRILLVDDDRDTLDACSLLLHYSGHECRTALTGKAALAELDRYAPDIVILDIGLPDMNGCELAVEIRARVGGGVYIAAMTGWNGPQEVAAIAAAGFDQQVVKPTDAEMLRGIVRSAEAARA